MQQPALAIATWGYGLASVAFAVLLFPLATGMRKGPRAAALFAAALLTALWAATNWMFAGTRWGDWLVLAGALDVLHSFAWQVVLLLILRRPGDRVDSSAFGRLWPATVVLVVIALGVQAAQFSRLLAPVDLGRLGLFSALALAIYGLVLIEQLWRGAAAESRWSIKPLCVGLGAATAFDVYHFADALLFSRYDADLWSARGFVYALVVPLIAIAAARARSDLRNDLFTVRVSRQVVFHTATLVASGIYLLFMAAAGYYVRYFGGEWGATLQIALFFAAVLLLVVIVASGSARAKLRVLVSKHFFRYRYDYREEWLRFTQSLSTTSSQVEMGEQIVRALCTLVESPAGALWTRDNEGATFKQAARWNMPASSGAEPSGSQLANFLATSGWVVNLEEFRSSPARYRDLELPEWLQDVPNAWLIVPLLVGSELTGFAVLATARTRLDINWEVNDLLKTAARQAASFMGQMHATEALLEARKFEAFNRMSAFVVHDLKNIIAQLSLLLKNAERHRANPEFQRDMLETIGHSVERMKQLMLQLREGNAPVNAVQGIELGSVIRQIVESKSGQSPIPVAEVEPGITTRGHRDKLERVIGHLVQNAVDATEPTGRVWIKLYHSENEAIVEVGDTGHGMTPEFIRDRLFRPFQTTKQAGMGIGAYESFHYVRELGGRVDVDSTPGKGTHIRLGLPLFEPARPAASAAATQAGDHGAPTDHREPAA